MSTPSEYHEAYKSECWGRKGFLGISISVAGMEIKPLSATCQEAVIRAEVLLREAFMRHKIASDKEEVEVAAQERREILELFPGAFFIEEISNEYCKEWCCSLRPWFRILTDVGWFKVGWRKRVLNIDWSETIVRKRGEMLWPSVRFTVGDRYVHAFDYEHAKSLIAEIRAAAKVAE